MQEQRDNPDRKNLSGFVLFYSTNWNLLNHVNPISLLCFSVIIYEFIL